MSLDLPNKDKGCHHTGFEKKCRDLVTCGLCDRWRVIPLEDADSGAFIKNHAACIDDYPYFQNLLLLKKADNTTKAVQQGNAEAKQRDLKNAAVQATVLQGVLGAAEIMKMAAGVVEQARIEDERKEQLALTFQVTNGQDH